MKQLKELYKGIQFYQTEEQGTYHGVSKDTIEKKANLIGAVIIKENDIFVPSNWETNEEVFFVDEDTFNSYAYVFTTNDLADIYKTLHKKYEDVFEKHDIGREWDFLDMNQLPENMHEDVLRLVKEKDFKSDFEQWEDVYEYFDGHNFKKVSLDEYSGYYPYELDYDVKKGYRVDGNTSHSIFYLTTEDTVIEEYNSYFQGDKSKHFHVLRKVEKEDWERAVENGYEVEL
ncbi:TPA: hypothetical protein QCU60_004319 [Bacillus cereus]|nr:hypothetical protein [Bacillus cereus]HDR6312333.1 hypothetical protein [Bacillus cereus]